MHLQASLRDVSPRPPGRLRRRHLHHHLAEQKVSRARPARMAPARWVPVWSSARARSEWEPPLAARGAAPAATPPAVPRRRRARSWRGAPASLAVTPRWMSPLSPCAPRRLPQTPAPQSARRAPHVRARWRSYGGLHGDGHPRCLARADHAEPRRGGHSQGLGFFEPGARQRSVLVNGRAPLWMRYSM